MYLRLAFALLTSLLLPKAAVAAPNITFAPAAPPTAQLTVTGTGFGLLQAVDIYFDTSNVCLAITTAAGGLTCPFRVPAGAGPGPHFITAVQRGGEGVQKLFTVRTNWLHSTGLRLRTPARISSKQHLAGERRRARHAEAGNPRGRCCDAAPVVYNGNVYLATVDGKLHARSTATGAAKAGFPKALGGTVTSGSARPSRHPTSLSPASDGKLYAFNAANGAATAGYPKALAGLGFQSSPAIANGNVYVGTSVSTSVFAFNASTGAAVRASRSPPTWRHAQPADARQRQALCRDNCGAVRLRCADRCCGPGLPGPRRRRRLELDDRRCCRQDCLAGEGGAQLARG